MYIPYNQYSQNQLFLLIDNNLSLEGVKGIFVPIRKTFYVLLVYKISAKSIIFQKLYIIMCLSHMHSLSKWCNLHIVCINNDTFISTLYSSGE